MKKSAQSVPNGFIPIHVLVLILVMGVAVTAIKVAENPNVLGSSVYLAESGDSTTGSSGRSQPQQQSKPTQPEQQSQPQPQQNQPQQQSRSQEGQNSGSGGSKDEFRPMERRDDGFRQDDPSRKNPEDKKFPVQQKFQQLQQEAQKFGFRIENSEEGSVNKQFPSIQGRFDVRVEDDGKGGQLDLNNKDTRVNLGSFQAIRSDGTKVEIDKEAREKIDAAIKLMTGSEISRSGNSFVFKRGDISAKTDLPMSFNVATKTFTVQTPNGEQEVKVLPDEALAKIKELDVDFSADSEDVDLDELNNEPVYHISGKKRQRFLGLIPFNITQTNVVSAKDGSIVETDQDFISRVLDSVSF